MSAIDDFGCDGDGCQRDAGELVETDDGARVLLCGRCCIAAEADAVTLANGRILYWDAWSGWALMPEPVMPPATDAGPPGGRDVVPTLDPEVLEVGHRDGSVTLQHAGPRGGLGHVYRLSPVQAWRLAEALRQRARAAQRREGDDGR